MEKGGRMPGVLSGVYRPSASGRYNLRELMTVGRIGATRNLSTMSNFERFPFKVKIDLFLFNSIQFRNVHFKIPQLEKVVYGETHSRVVGTVVEISVRIAQSIEERQTSCHQVG